MFSCKKLRAVTKAATGFRAGGLHQLLHGAWYGQQWSREGLPARTAHLVLDEADALLSGGFRDHTERVLEVRTVRVRVRFDVRVSCIG